MFDSFIACYCLYEEYCFILQGMRFSAFFLFCILCSFSCFVETKSLTGKFSTKKTIKEEHFQKLSAQKESKEKVINTPPVSVYPVHQQIEGESGKKLLDLKPVSADWLEHYPSIKKEVEKIIQTKKQEITKSAEELFNDNPHSNLLPYRLYIKELKLFQPKNKDIVSVRLKIYTYTGGAHGGTFYYSWNWSQKKQKFLSLNEVLSSEQFIQIVKKTRKLLFEKEKQGNKYDKYRKRDIHLGTDEKKDFTIWNLHQDMIIFVFPEYQVASYAAGSFEVHVSL